VFADAPMQYPLAMQTAALGTSTRQNLTTAALGVVYGDIVARTLDRENSVDVIAQPLAPQFPHPACFTPLARARQDF
jgi:hypothetical protein